MTGPGVTIPVPLRRREERRASDRFVASMPVRVDGEEGTTRDLSAGGLSFVAERSYEIGATIEVVVEYILDGHHYPLRCRAQVVRVQPCDAGFSVGARLMPQVDGADVHPGAVGDTLRPLRGV
jgi:hypothetical protein